MPRNAQPPSLWATAGEALAPAELFRLAAATNRLRKLPRGEGGPVVLVPGMGATDASMQLMRQFLRNLGHDARSAGLGRIHRGVPELVERLTERTVEVHGAADRPVALVGWSVGGIMAREVARLRPDLVARVITFGSPIAGGPAGTVMHFRYSDDELEQIAAAMEDRRATPIQVPVTAMWSRRDGVAAPRACIDRESPDVENVEVSSTHLGMGVDPDVWSVIATRLVGLRSQVAT